jgi:16S rRNA processing protein RimM
MSQVQVGRLARPHGVRGEMMLDSISLTADELQNIGTFTWRGASGATRPLTIAAIRPASGRMLVRFAGIDDRDQAAMLTRGTLWAESERLPDPGPGMAYAFQLVGLEVVEQDGRRLGVLEEVWPTGANPIYVVRREGKELLLPATPTVVQKIDLDARRMTVALPAGLEDL